ncbi:MAG: fibrillarin-like rRNA/tRNA 2'-O-methyltransferase [Candidatus Woesearchaeota archaeon]
MQIRKSKFYGVFESDEKKRRIFTQNLNPGVQVYGEQIVLSGGYEFREWNPMRSKLAAFIMRGANQIAVKPGSKVLYLGAASGTTVSHVSDIVGEEGFIFAVDFAPRVVRDLFFLARERHNIAPILADANMPESYAHLISSVDFIYQDVAQPNQVEIFLKNAELFLRDGGFAMIAIKARSIDVTKQPKIIFENAKKIISKKLLIVDFRELDPYERDHCIILCKKKR